MKLIASSKQLPLASLISIKSLKTAPEITVEWTRDRKSRFDGVAFDSDASMCRYIARSFSTYNLYGSSTLEYLEVDHWLSFGMGPLWNKPLENSIDYLDKELATVTYLVGKALTIADIFIWSALAQRQEWIDCETKDKYPNLMRWYAFIESHPCVPETLKMPEVIVGVSRTRLRVIEGTSTTPTRKEEGKFIELPGAVHGKVVVRFPPEASGYLHIGHAKAALLNQHYKDHFDGKLVMRFDDTNPAKEKIDFEKVILQDLELLQIKPDKFSHTSDYFDLMLQYCEKLLNEGKAYVDDTDPETMKAEREKKVESKHRSNSVADNMRMWQEMLNGTERGVTCCVRAKIDMNSANGCMRDPTIYRCKPESHPKTGKKYKVYPTYDFACPIVDSIEGITHCLRTTEYHDRDDQFYWFIDTLGLRKPYIWEYSRLNMMNTVLSKRKLTWFVEEGLVDGWNDPRFPTVQGVMRRGMTVEGLKQFIIAQGSSRSVVMMSWDKIWSFNKKVIDPIAPRYSAVELYDHIPVHVKGAKTEKVEVPKHPKNEEVGTKWVWKSDQILIDRIDADALKENENATFINWGNLLIKKINRDDRWITSIEAEENLSNTDYKGTLKLTWLARVEEAPLVPCICIYFDHLITKPVLGKDEDFKQFLNPNTKTDVKMLGDQELMNVKKGEIIQLQRRGFFICDEEYKPPSIYTSEVGPVILFFVPDGHSKENPITAHSVTKHSAKAPVKPQASKKKKSTSANEETSVTKTYDQAALKEIAKLLDRIKDQGALVRKLKTEAVPNQNTIDSEVRFLLGLKAEFKEVASVDWKPGLTIESFKPSDNVEKKVENGDKPPSSSSADFASVDLHTKISVKSSKVRSLQKKKADKNLINTELTALADLKEKYKAQTGKSWVAEAINLDTYYDEYVNRLYNTVADQGNRVRDLKKAKASNKDIESEVGKLLALKAAYRDTTGEEYRPAPVAAASTSNGKTEVQPAASMSDKGAAIHEQIVAQGNKVRDLKANKSTSKEAINTEVKALLELKEEYKKATGVAWSPTPAPQGNAPAPKKAEAPKKPAAEKPAKTKQPQKQQKAPAAAASASSDVKKQTRLGLEVKKDENLSDWYTQIITKSELIEYYDVSGCYTLRPWAYAIWKAIRKWMDDEITKMGVDECYFPIFVSRNALEREKSHIADFSPEVAWVTKSGDSELEEPVAIRPTSETVMYPAYAKWIRSHRDLPMKLNQWNNVVRWEFKHPQPFLRTREFLWQEGHTAFATYPEAEKEVYEVLEMYAKVYEYLLAVPVVRGRKTEKEKFAGGDFTTTVEAFISASGRGIQGGTSHHLGQNFSKMFDIVFEDPETQEKKHVYQNSWGMTTRTIGVMIMIHGDDQGLVLPPRVAKIQAVIVPCGITANLKAADRQSLDESCTGLEKVLNEAGVKVHYDSRDNYSSGWKFNHWELKGVPVRIELGPKDMQQNQVVAVRRDTGEKITLRRENVGDRITELLANIQQSLYDKADKDMKDHTKLCENWSDFVNILNDKNILLSPFCGEMSCEDNIKRDSTRNEIDPGAPAMGAKSLCIPFAQPKQNAPSQKCIHPECGQNAKFYVLFGRSY